jgi:cytochrome c-type biogenesis protein
MRGIGGWAAFTAGLFSFLSPCVLPLVPGYISFVSGFSLEELSGREKFSSVRWEAAMASVFFVLGFSVFFTALGASASAVGRLLGNYLPLLSKIGGLVIVAFGLHLTGLIPLRWLYYERRAQATHLAPGAFGAFVMGLAFACGWTPCIGPILAGILALAATEKTVASGVSLLLLYCLGLGIPFIAAGLSVSTFLKFFARYRRFIRAGEISAGALLILIGLLIFTRRLQWIAGSLPSSLMRFAQ